MKNRSLTACIITLLIASMTAGCGMQKEAVAAMILPAILPFNLSKAGINSIITFFIYKRISKLIHKAQGTPGSH